MENQTSVDPQRNSYFDYFSSSIILVMQLLILLKQFKIKLINISDCFKIEMEPNTPRKE